MDTHPALLLRIQNLVAAENLAVETLAEVLDKSDLVGLGNLGSRSFAVEIAVAEEEPELHCSCTAPNDFVEEIEVAAADSRLGDKRLFALNRRDQDSRTLRRSRSYFELC